ncbi:MAG TPA: DUF2157 domain-containing protein [Pseudoneobacillus sp.]|nr:DUF2157 domain-containing protein [Pseudoneobacillus sp.]
MKRKISSYQFNIVKKELLHWEEVGELLPNQAEKLLQQYEITDRQINREASNYSLNFIQIISIIGAILIGLGVLSFVASNWSAMSDLEKFSLLLFTLFISYIGAWWTEVKRPNTSKALYYIGAFMYGAEIFYIGQMFHLGGELGTALMAWAIGILPLAIYRKDLILYGAAYGLFYLSIELTFMLPDNGDPSLWMVAIIPLLFVGNRYVKQFRNYLLIANFFLLYQFIEMRFMFGKEDLWVWMIPIIIGLFVLNKYVYPKEPYLVIANFILLYQFAELTLFMRAIDNIYYAPGFGLLTLFLIIIGHKWMNKSVILFVANVILSIQLLFLILYHLDVEALFMYFLITFVIGIVFTHFSIKGYEDVMKWMGYILQLISGIFLTIPFAYEKMTTAPIWMFFGLGYMIYGMYLVYKNNLIGVLIVSLLIFRFYVDLSLVFMNKSIAFLIGGILLLGLGYWFEKTRRGEGKNDPKTNSK